MTTAAVIVTMNRQDVLSRCIESLWSEGVDEILVIDNGDGPNIANATHIRMAENLGPAGGYAAGMTAAADRGHEVLWLFNDDDQPLPGSHRVLRAAFDQPDIAAVGSRIVHGNETRNRGELWVGRGIKPVWNGPYAWVDVTTFSGLMMRAEIVRKVGVPRADLFMMFEEHEYCLRVRQAGYRIKVLAEPQARALTLGTGPAAQWREYYRARNHLRVALDHRSPREVGWWAVRQVRLLVASRSARVWTHLRYASRGWVDGVRGKMGRTVEPTTSYPGPLE